MYKPIRSDPFADGNNDQMNQILHFLHLDAVRSGEQLALKDVKELGSGSYGTVGLKSDLKDPRKLFIVKQSRSPSSRNSTSSYLSFLTEVVIRRYIEQHVKLPIDPVYAVYRPESSSLVCVAMQCDENRLDSLSLDHLLDPTSRPSVKVSSVFPDTNLYEVMLEVAKQMTKMHAAGVVHRDLDVCNIVIEYTVQRQMIVKIIDFGSSQFTARVDPSVRRALESHRKFAADLICRTKYTFPNDRPLFDGQKTLGIPIAGHLRNLDPCVVFTGDQLQHVDLYAADVFAFGCILAYIRRVFPAFGQEFSGNKNQVDPARVLARMKDPSTRHHLVPFPEPMELNEHPIFWKLVNCCCNVELEQARLTFADIVEFMETHRSDLVRDIQIPRRARHKTVT